VLPEGQFLAQTFGLAQDFLGGALIVPETGLAAAAVKFG
jgi:hypothetical protein